MKQALSDVAEFMRASEQPMRHRPRIAPDAEAQLRLKLKAEEITEYAQAAAAKDLVELADACVDILYVVFGSAHTYGFAPVLQELWDEVHRSNMDKRFPDGKFHQDGNGKTTKPPGWTPPDLKSILDRAMKSRFGKPPG